MSIYQTGKRYNWSWIMDPKFLVIAGFFLATALGGWWLMQPDPEDDLRWFRDLRIESWQRVIGESSQLDTVISELESTYGPGAPRPQIDMAETDFLPGNWSYEFAQLAEKSLAEENYQAAAGYFMMANYPQVPATANSQSDAMHLKSLSSFEHWLTRDNHDYEKLSIPVDDQYITAYLVLPKTNTDKALPVVLQTGGIDSFFLAGFPDYLQGWEPLNIGWVGFDIAGLGTAKGLTLDFKAEKVHQAVIKHLLAHPRVDAKNLFVYSRSMGGYAALRLAAIPNPDYNLAGVIAGCAVAEHVFKRRWLALLNMPKMTRHALAARLNIEPNNYLGLAKAVKSFQFSRQGIWQAGITDTPLLVFNTPDDYLNPVSEIKEMAALSSNGQFALLDGEVGHCGSRTKGLIAATQFVKEHLR